MRGGVRLILSILLWVLLCVAIEQPLAAQSTPQAKVPNIFTPNNDGINDTFELESTKPITFSVFNRGGALVYHVVAQHIIWDGTDERGHEIADGVYFYVLQDPAHTYKEEKGFLYISRNTKVKEVAGTSKKS